MSIASIATAGVTFLKDSVDQAMAYESTMADVTKVVDGLRDENGRLTESYYEISDALLDMSTRIPMTAEELGEIMAAAGQAGIAEEDLISFTETAAKMGIAFDTSADQAGDWMATWRTAFGMNQEEVVALADQINYLGNTTSENTQKLSGVVTRIGALGKTAGLSGAEIAAMAASMTGVTEEISATGIKNLMLTMTAGAAATDKQQGVLNKLGFSAEQLAERMQVDAKGAILDLLGAIKQLPDAEQAAVLTQYFGKESVAAIAPLLSNLGYLEEQFNKVGDSSLYAGSMEAEFQARSDTTANKIQLAQQSIQALQIKLGEKLLPVVGKLADAVSIGVDKLSGFFEVIGPALPYIATFAGSLASMILAQKAFNAAVANGATVAAGFGKAIGFLTSPMGIAMVAIAALIAAGVLLYKNWDTVKAKAQELWEKVTVVFGGIKDAIVSAFESAKQKVAGFFSWIDNKVSSIPILGSLYDAGKTGAKIIGAKLMEHPVPAMASGGIVTAPTLSMIGEGGEPEAVLPLSKLERMLEGISTGEGGKIVFAPTIEIKGNANRKDVEEAVEISFEKFKQLMRRYEREKRRVAF
ncbi:MAG: phage tail tape measure protein [Anaerotignum sp.]|nr:phage tail tape measure protein [Anaerotignum sp.]